MTTQYIPLHEYRKNLSSLWKKSVQENTKYIVMVHSVPMFEITPFTDTKNEWDTVVTTKNKASYKKAKKEQKNGESLSLSDLEKELLPLL